MDEATTNVLDDCVVASESVNIIGACLNLSLGNGPEAIIYSGKVDKFIEIIALLINQYLKGENKDYLGTALMIVIKFSDKEDYRKLLRSHFLTARSNK